MSLKNSSSTSVYCKVCHDAGKSKSEYSNHYTREFIGGPICCPTLLSLECRYCFQKGHTVSYCPVLKAKQDKLKTELRELEQENRKKIYEEKQEQENLKKMSLFPKLKNKWDILDEDDEEEEDIKLPDIRVASYTQVTYASVAKSSKILPVKETPTPMPAFKPTYKLYKGSWASDTESDDEC
jgi:hypothetical protein